MAAHEKQAVVLPHKFRKPLDVLKAPVVGWRILICQAWRQYPMSPGIASLSV